tara:strand:- start:355 stop:510 length:156 start_codon:yes stop_codon:yes gene_type:complete
MNGLQIAIINAIGISNSTVFVPPVVSFDIISQQGDSIITEVSDFQMILESV